MKLQNVINECIEIERTTASIYKKMMQIFPDRKEFWKNLFDDEVEHLSFLNDVKSLGLVDEMEKIDFLPSKAVIKKTLKLADTIKERISTSPLSIEEALKITLKLEKSVVETYTNKLIANLISCDESRSGQLITDENTHVDKIIRMMKII